MQQISTASDNPTILPAAQPPSTQLSAIADRAEQVASSEGGGEESQWATLVSDFSKAAEEYETSATELRAAADRVFNRHTNLLSRLADGSYQKALEAFRTYATAALGHGDPLDQIYDSADRKTRDILNEAAVGQDYVKTDEFKDDRSSFEVLTSQFEPSSAKAEPALERVAASAAKSAKAAKYIAKLEDAARRVRENIGVLVAVDSTKKALSKIDILSQIATLRERIRSFEVVFDWGQYLEKHWKTAIAWGTLIVLAWHVLLSFFAAFFASLKSLSWLPFIYWRPLITTEDLPVAIAGVVIFGGAAFAYFRLLRRRAYGKALTDPDNFSSTDVLSPDRAPPLGYQVRQAAAWLVVVASICFFWDIAYVNFLGVHGINRIGKKGDPAICYTGKRIIDSGDRTVVLITNAEGNNIVVWNNDSIADEERECERPLSGKASAELDKHATGAGDTGSSAAQPQSHSADTANRPDVQHGQAAGPLGADRSDPNKSEPAGSKRDTAGEKPSEPGQTTGSGSKQANAQAGISGDTVTDKVKTPHPSTDAATGKSETANQPIDAKLVAREIARNLAQKLGNLDEQGAELGKLVGNNDRVVYGCLQSIGESLQVDTEVIAQIGAAEACMVQMEKNDGLGDRLKHVVIPDSSCHTTFKTLKTALQKAKRPICPIADLSSHTAFPNAKPSSNGK